MEENVISDDTSRILGRDAQRNNILAARAVAETVKTTLGPKGMDKMLVDRLGDIIVTNDGVTILEEMDIEHPAAKMIVEVARTQESEVGDGTTTAVMLAGKLLENAEKLLDKKIHATLIARGYRIAGEKAKEILEELAQDLESEEELEMIARTAMTGKGAEYLRDEFSKIVVDAVKIIGDGKKVNLEDIKLEKKVGGSLEDTELIEGIVIDKEKVNIDMPEIVKNAKIALIEEALEVKGLEREAQLSISSPEQFQNFVSGEDRILKEKVEKIKKSSANVVFCQRGIDDVVQFYLAKEGIYAVRRIPKSEMQGLSRAVGGRIVSKLDELTEADLGSAKVVEEKRERDEAMTYVRGCSNPQALTILIRGGTEHVLCEIERALKDALGDISSAIENSKIVAGGGAIEIELSKELKNYARGLSGRERLAVEEFADALEFIPSTLAENAGLDPIDLLTELQSLHNKGYSHYGLNLNNNRVEDTFVKGIIEPLKVKTQAISSAMEVAIMILRIDDVIASKGKKGKGGLLRNMEDYE